MNMNYKKYEKLTVYSAEKCNKRDNFTFLNENYCEKGQTVLAGDSITEMFNHTELFAQYEKERTLRVYNRGISGDTSNRLYERFADNVLSIEPKNIVLLIGTNDINVGADDDCIVGNIRKILELTEKSLPDVNIIVLGVYPVNTSVGRQGLRKNSRIKCLNEKIKALCVEQGVRFLNINAQLADENGNLSAELTYDGLHINARGFEKAANSIIPLLK